MRLTAAMIETLRTEWCRPWSALLPVAGLLAKLRNRERSQETAGRVRREGRGGQMSKYAFELQQFLTRIIEELRASGLSEEQIVSVFKNAAKDFAADMVERVEKREGRKLSDEEIGEISEAARRNARAGEPAMTGPRVSHPPNHIQHRCHHTGDG